MDSDVRAMPDWDAHIAELKKERDSGNPLTIEEFESLLFWTWFLNGTEPTKHGQASELRALASEEQAMVIEKYADEVRKRTKEVKDGIREKEAAGLAVTELERFSSEWQPLGADESRQLCAGLSFGAKRHKSWMEKRLEAGTRGLKRLDTRDVRSG